MRLSASNGSFFLFFLWILFDCMFGRGYGWFSICMKFVFICFFLWRNVFFYEFFFFLILTFFLFFLLVLCNSSYITASGYFFFLPGFSHLVFFSVSSPERSAHVKIPKTFQYIHHIFIFRNFVFILFLCVDLLFCSLNVFGFFFALFFCSLFVAIVVNAITLRYHGFFFSRPYQGIFFVVVGSISHHKILFGNIFARSLKTIAKFWKWIETKEKWIRIKKKSQRIFFSITLCFLTLSLSHSAFCHPISIEVYWYIFLKSISMPMQNIYILCCHPPI